MPAPNQSYWYLVMDGPASGPMNMAVDEVLFTRQSSIPVLRLYRWDKPTVSLGVAQQAERHVRIAYCRDNDIPIIKRPTGGKAVLHDDELTYSLSGPMHQPPFNTDLLGSYREIGRAFCESFRLLNIRAVMASHDTRAVKGGISSCFANPSAYEILVDGKKLLGSAQKRSRDRVLQHGSLMIRYNETDWRNVLRKHSDDSTDRVIDLSSILGKRLNVNAIVSALCRGFEAYFKITLKLSKLTDDEWKRAESLAQIKYIDLAPLTLTEKPERF